MLKLNHIESYSLSFSKNFGNEKHYEMNVSLNPTETDIWCLIYAPAVHSFEIRNRTLWQYIFKVVTYIYMCIKV